MRDLMAVFRALGDENRVRILWSLEGRELCVCQIVELLRLAVSTVSKHLSVLKDARLVDSRKDGRWIYYRLADSDVPAEAIEATRLVLNALKHTKQAADDARRLKEILRMDQEELCRRQNTCRS